MNHPTRTQPAPARRPATSTTIAARRIADSETVFWTGHSPVSPPPAAAQVGTTRLLPKAPPAPVAEPVSRLHPLFWAGLGALGTLLAVAIGFWIWHG